MAVRLVIWNCDMALHTKVGPLMQLQPDIAIVPECAQPEIITQKTNGFKFSDAVWIGRTENSGLGVFTFDGSSVAVSDLYDDRFEHVLPVMISGGFDFNLLAVWAFNYQTDSKESKNGDHVRKALKYFREFIQSRPTVVAGDFNHSVPPAGSDQQTNYVPIADDLGKIGLGSAYSKWFCCEYGQEPDAASMWKQSLSQSYNIDYCFLPENWLHRIKMVTIGEPKKWVLYSDHVPMVVELELD